MLLSLDCTVLSQAWGDEAKDVQFILKRVSSRAASGKRQKVKRTNSKLLTRLAEGLPSESEAEVASMQGNIQALLKIIISQVWTQFSHTEGCFYVTLQRETIQTQLGNLKAKDLYLKTLDKSLSCSDGREYVLRNYLEQIPEHAEVRAHIHHTANYILGLQEQLEESQDSGCGSGNDTQVTPCRRAGPT